MTNLLLAPGEADPADLVAAADDGLYVRMVGDGRYHPDTDTFSFDVVEAYRIEAGRLTHPVTGVRLMGRARTALAGLAAVGRDFALDAARGVCGKHGQVVPVAVGMPTVLVHGLTVHP